MNDKISIKNFTGYEKLIFLLILLMLFYCLYSRFITQNTTKIYIEQLMVQTEQLAQKQINIDKSLERTNQKYKENMSLIYNLYAISDLKEKKQTTKYLWWKLWRKNESNKQ